MASPSLEMCSHQQVSWSCIIQLVTSFESPLKYTQGIKGRGGAGESTWLGNTAVEIQLHWFEMPFPMYSKLSLCTVKTRRQLRMHLPSWRNLSRNAWCIQAWEDSVYPTQADATQYTTEPCWCSWLCPYHRGTLGFDTSISCLPAAASTDHLPWALTVSLCLETVMAIRLLKPNTNTNHPLKIYCLLFKNE